MNPRALKLVSVCAGLFILTSSFTLLAQHSQEATLEREANEKIKVFATQLKGELSSAIQEQGLAHAVTVCKDKAPEIARSLSTDGWTLARTSLGVRNPDNAPNEWERGVMLAFDKAYKGGKSAADLHVSKIDDTSFYYMKAIETSQVCLACHGSNVNESLLKHINTQYPKDSATGFTLDELRGAFTLQKTISE
uniref:Tll0287-like domain-containing protein n=1 Tax=Ningiella ruwaisensis TaxID=2364274 RepID=UPI00144539AD|nr:DUF3365 domain-containing protein [Ningiella ruwaisensis]